MGRFTTPFLPPPSALIPSYFRGVQDGKRGKGTSFISPRVNHATAGHDSQGEGRRKVRER